mmetsp:Transcript_17736/g.42542  ORF Transcript_17736/g.42542 Transcript_17736/m.42542 type:complete len:281 (+) Transcript_17736:263-1105(+)
MEGEGGLPTPSPPAEAARGFDNRGASIIVEIVVVGRNWAPQAERVLQEDRDEEERDRDPHEEGELPRGRADKPAKELRLGHPIHKQPPGEKHSEGLEGVDSGVGPLRLGPAAVQVLALIPGVRVEVDAGDQPALAAAVGAQRRAVLAGLELGLAKGELERVGAAVLVLYPRPALEPDPVRAEDLELIDECPREQVGGQLGLRQEFPCHWTPASAADALQYACAAERVSVRREHRIAQDLAAEWTVEIRWRWRCEKIYLCISVSICFYKGDGGLRGILFRL